MSANRWEIKVMSLDKLKVAEHNPRSISNNKFKGLVNTIKRFGLVEPIVWNERTERVVGGHQRLRALIELGKKESLVMVVDFGEEEELAANLTLNNPEIEGEFDEPINDLLSKLQADEPTMFKETNLNMLQKALESNLERLPGSIEPPAGGYQTKCPCCGNEWEVLAADVSVEGVN